MGLPERLTHRAVPSVGGAAKSLRQSQSDEALEAILGLASKVSLIVGGRVVVVMHPAAAHFDPSTTDGPALREALRALSVMNVIEIRPGSGAYVSALQPEQLVQHLDFVFSLDNSSIFHLFDARKTLELRTVALAVDNISDEEIAKLENYLAQMAANIDSPEKCDALDREFHKTIAAAARNPILFQFVSVVNQLGTNSRQQSYKLPEALRQTFGEHQAIVDALKLRDLEQAQAAMLNHLNHAEINLRRLLLGEEAAMS